MCIFDKCLKTRKQKCSFGKFLVYYCLCKLRWHKAEQTGFRLDCIAESFVPSHVPQPFHLILYIGNNMEQFSALIPKTVVSFAEIFFCFGGIVQYSSSKICGTYKYIIFCEKNIGKSGKFFSIRLEITFHAIHIIIHALIYSGKRFLRYLRL